MITRPLMMAAASDTAYSFQYTVNTAASSSSDKKTGLPVNLYGQDGVVIDVDWGDGTTSTLTSASYTASDSTASVHTYASAGTYTVTATSKNWSDAYLLSVYADAAISSNNCNAPVYWWRRTLTGIVNALPPVKGVKGITGASATAYTARDNDLGFLFHRCEKMTSLPASLFANCGHIQIFNSTFYNCIALPSLPAGLFDPCVSATNFSDCFRYCTALTSIPVSFFKYCTAATNMYNVFRFCNKVPSVPADLFLYNTNVTNLGGAFSKCDALKNFTLCIGSPNVATVTDFILNASGVTRIVCVPADSTTYTSFNAYKNTSNNVTVSTNNADCGIEEIDDGTWQFTVNTQATASGEKKAAIPFNLYGQTGIELTVDWGDNTTSTLTSSDYTQSDATASVHEYASAGEYTITVTSNDWENTYISNVDESSYDPFEDLESSLESKNALVPFYWWHRTLINVAKPLPLIKGIRKTAFNGGYSVLTNKLSYLFYKCKKIASIPSKLFDKNTLTTAFNRCFEECTSLASIPSGLFDKNTSVTSFYHCFDGCSSITSIPSKLFDNNTTVTDFSYCFEGCSSLASIPSGLFDKNTSVNSFVNSFTNCSSLTSIPSELFDKNTLVREFSSCFQGCSSLTSIPSGLFDKNTAATNFDYCFLGCSSLATIPSGLFYKNTSVKSFSYCFYNCSNLLNFHLKIGSTYVNSFGAFISNASNVERVICVPTTGTTKTTVQNFANNSNNVIVSTDFIDCSEAWEFTIDTEATTAGNTKTGIPFTLNGQSSIRLLVDWGDGNTSTLASSNYTSSNISASLHEYESPGEYNVTVYSNDWENTYILGRQYANPISDYYSDTNSCIALYWWQRTLISLDNALPRIKGVKLFTDTILTSTSSYANKLSYIFGGCDHLTSVDSTLFSKNTTVTLADNCFTSCSSLASLPVDLFKYNTEITSFESAFYHCSQLTSVPANLFKYNTKVTSFNYTFGYTRLTSLPAGLFDYNINVTDFSQCFVFCERLTTISSGLFDKNTKVTNYSECFSSCTRLQSIPSGLFDKNTKVTNFHSCFNTCVSLTSIPSGLFDKNTDVTDFSDCFYYCNHLASIPSGLFDKNTKVTNFSDCFGYCTTISSIPSGLFDKNIVVTSFISCFRGCSSIQSIPSGLFDKNTAVTSFGSCFHNCTSLQSIPSGLFGKNTAVTSFANCFSGCTNLLDFHLRIGSSSVTTFSSFISDASNVDRILCVQDNSTTYTNASSFANASNGVIVSTDYIDCAEVWEFTVDTEAVVSGNKKSGIPFVLLHENADIVLLVDWGDGTSQRLTSANYTAGTVTPTHIYPDYRASVHTYAAAGRYTITVASSNWENTYLYVVSFADLLYEGNANSAMWWYRRTLVSVDTPFPKIKGTMCSNSTGGDVDYNPTVTANSFEYAFMGCQALTTIPSNLFDNNASATNFQRCFSNCTAITSIPPAIFSKHVNATDFTYCFASCSSLASIPSNLFVNNTKATNWYYTFYGCSSITSIPAGLFDTQVNTTRFDNCFYHCTSLTSIPYNLFHKNTKVTTFSRCFSTCTSLTSIPAGLFDKNTSAAAFNYCFENCTALTHIPAELFDKNTNATGFYDTFTGCTSLASVPNGLFAKNTKVTNFSECFAGCTSLLNFHLKIGSSSVAYFDSFIPDASNVDRILCVPASSTTYTKATAFASANNGVIVSTDIIDCAEAWEFTINTEATASGEKKTGIPFNLTGQTNVEMLIDWGDNTTSTVSASDYTVSDSTASVHEYSSAGQYTVTIYASNWNNVYLITYPVEGNNDPSNAVSGIYWFRRTLKTINNALPKVKGTKSYNSSYTPSSFTTNNDSLQDCFSYCKKLTTVSSDLFSQNTSNTSFRDAFYYCTLLSSVPSSLFSNNKAVTEFAYCFAYSGIQSVPSGLFDSNTEVTSFHGCFSQCYSLRTIPTGMFDNNSKVVYYASVFSGCRYLQSVPAGLFDYSPLVENFGSTFEQCETIRTIPVGLFDNNPAVTTFRGVFNGCLSVQSIPENLFLNNIAVTDMSTCFFNCNSVGNFTLNIGSSLVTYAPTFVSKKANTTRILNVPSHSSTYTTFSKLTTSLGLTLRGV